MPKFSAHLDYLFTDRPLLQRIDAAAAAGFKAVEGRFRTCRPPTTSARSSATTSARSASIRRWAEGASSAWLRCLAARPTGTNHSRKRSTMSPPSAPRRCIAWPARSIPASARRLKKYSSKISSVPPIWPRQKTSNSISSRSTRATSRASFLSQVEHAADIIAKVGRPNVWMQYDFYHVQIVGGDLIRRLEKHFAIVGHIQCSQVPVRGEPNEQGEINYPFIFSEVDRLGYKEWIGCEYRPTGTTESGLGWGAKYGLIASP